ncbi:hypothetical protein NC652_008866 [Populus alba x Populus x berolinensis]|nr:hypothetical protein NC652_008866 [Populus alba x Populus x berolinensis]
MFVGIYISLILSCFSCICLNFLSLFLPSCQSHVGLK